jgi:hypothetical protein
MQPRFGPGPHRRIETGGGVSHFAALAQKAPNAAITRKLEGGWLPIPVISLEKDGVLYQQRTFVAPVGISGSDSPRWNHPSVAVVEFVVTNTTQETAKANSGPRFPGGFDREDSRPVERTGRGLLDSQTKRSDGLA